MRKSLYKTQSKHDFSHGDYNCHMVIRRRSPATAQPTKLLPTESHTQLDFIVIVRYLSCYGRSLVDDSDTTR